MEGSWLQGEARTLESLATNQENYEREEQGDRAKLMQFYNCEFQVGQSIVPNSRFSNFSPVYKL